MWLYRYLMGYLIITVKGEFSEKILNLCAANRIFLWNSKIIKNGIETCIFIRDFLRLREIISGSKLKIHIIKKIGLPIKLARNKKRTGFFIGMICMLVILELMSGYIWVIDIDGNKSVKSEEIIKACQDIGIKEGIRAEKINPKIQREQLLLRLDSLAWASLNVEGSRLTINVSEIKEQGKLKDLPTNLKSKADGIIKRINVTSGNCLVKIGDTVKSGDMLVSGVIEASDGTRFVKSTGSIIAETTKIVKATGDYKEIKILETGAMKTKSVLELFTLKIPLFLGSETQKYKAYKDIKQPKLFGKSLPVKLYQKEFIFIDEQAVELSREELIEKLREEINSKLKEDEGGYEILEEIIKDTQKGLEIEVLVRREEEITLPETILIGGEN